MTRLTMTILAGMAFAMATVAHGQSRPSDRLLADTDACVLSDPAASYFDTLDRVPEPIRKDLLAHTGPMAARDEAFNATDFSTSTTAALPSHRFLRAAHSGLRWMIWYEHGGYGDHVHLATYVLAVHGTDPTPFASLSNNLVGAPCASAEAVLKGVTAAGPRDW